MGDNKQARSFDAIVIGSGMSGGWAAKEFCEKGLKTLVLERGRNVVHLKDYPTANMNPWDFPHRGRMTNTFMKENPLITEAAGFDESTAHFFIKDNDHPYVQEKPFEWIRGYQVGGKSLIWGRACPRWSPLNSPILLNSDMVSSGPSAMMKWRHGIPMWNGLPGSVATWTVWKPCLMVNICLLRLQLRRKHLQVKISSNYKDRFMIQNDGPIDSVTPIHIHQGRGRRQVRDLCMRGCPFGGYFSSNSSTLPWAQKTGNLTIRPFSVVHSILYDEKKAGLPEYVLIQIPKKY
jgi:choline dehydrogenase-like flavoprotein